jgi:hypothetical protein
MEKWINGTRKQRSPTTAQSTHLPEAGVAASIASMKLLLRLFSCSLWDKLDLAGQVIDPPNQALDHLAAVAA